MAEGTGDNWDFGGGVVRLLDERTPGDIRFCACCLDAVDRDAYFAGHFYCPTCVERAEDYPWRTTHGGIAP